MRILKIWFSEYPWDIRIEKIVRALQGAGHEVHLVCRNSRGERRDEYATLCRIHRLPAITRGPSRANALLNVPAFFNPAWLATIMRCIRGHRPDVIVVRDLPLTLTTLLAGRLAAIPVVYDMAECHPEIFKNYFRWGLRSLLIENPFMARWVERIALHGMAHTFVMCEESAERLRSLGVPRERITVVSNTTLFAPVAHAKSKARSHDPLQLVYIGLVAALRGLDVVVEAVARARRVHGQPVRLDVVGEGTHLPRLRVLAEKLGVTDLVRFHGWVDHVKIDRFMREADVGVLPLYDVSHYNVTLPNKLFDYMAFGLPVLTSNVRPVARIVGETDAGLVYPDKDVDQLVKCLRALRDPELRERLGGNGRRAVADKYNWSVDAARMLKVFDALAPCGTEAKVAAARVEGPMVLGPSPGERQDTLPNG